MPLLAPRSGNEVAYVTQIIDDLHLAFDMCRTSLVTFIFQWQA